MFQIFVSLPNMLLYPPLKLLPDKFPTYQIM